MFDINKPDFPKGKLSLKRGSILRANQDISYLGFKEGDEFPIGFDGEYVRCTGLTWSIGQLEDEILGGFWTITGREVPLSDETVARKFACIIEQRKEFAN